MGRWRKYRCVVFSSCFSPPPPPPHHLFWVQTAENKSSTSVFSGLYIHFLTGEKMPGTPPPHLPPVFVLAYREQKKIQTKTYNGFVAILVFFFFSFLLTRTYPRLYSVCVPNHDFPRVSIAWPLQRILTPTQTAKFVLWVSKNKACVHMLNQLWDKLHGDAGSDGSP